MLMAGAAATMSILALPVVITGQRDNLQIVSFH